MGTKITTIAFDKDILDALDAFCRSKKPKMSRTAVVNLVVLDHLIKVKAWPPKRSK